MELTIEQALNNLIAVAEKFIGTKQEHIAIDHSLKLIKDELTKGVQNTNDTKPTV
jgi:hypothetical protein